jgi:phosphatidylglycerol:prolipoprotein diacylglycerol transferase
LHSVLFKIGPIPIRAYGLMMWFALLVGLIRTLRASKRSGLTSEQVVDIAVYALLSGILFAHLTSIALDLPYYLRNPSEIGGLWSGMFSAGGGLRGLSFHGGFAGGILAGYIYARRKGLSFLTVIDLFAPGLALGYGIARIGCFLNGCCYGCPAKLPWAVRFMADGHLTPPSHPTQIYAILASFAIFGILVWIEKRRRFGGQVFFSYVALYGVYRFLVEFPRRGITADVAFAGLTEAQVVSIVMIVGASAFLWVRSRRTESLDSSTPRPLESSTRGK